MAISVAKNIRKRKHPRFQTFTKAKLRSAGSTDWTECSVINVSEGGACLSSKVIPLPGTIVELLIPHRTNKYKGHQVKAKVCWAKGNEFGVQFMKS